MTRFIKNISRRAANLCQIVDEFIDETCARQQREGEAESVNDDNVERSATLKDVDRMVETIALSKNLRRASQIAIKTSSVGILSTLGSAAQTLGSPQTGDALTKAAQSVRVQSADAAHNLPIVGDVASRIVDKIGGVANAAGKIAGQATASAVQTSIDAVAPTEQNPDNRPVQDYATCRRIMKRLPLSAIERFALSIYLFFHYATRKMLRMIRIKWDYPMRTLFKGQYITFF